MDQFIRKWFSAIRFGRPRNFGRMHIFPIYHDRTGGPEYLTLGEALKSGLLTITEVNESGSVPELKAVNRAELPILILDGEQLVGSKQDRVTNATILVPPMEAITIPVSCTEAGRWTYTSRAFTEAEFVMPAEIRKRKAGYIAESLKGGRGFEGDQGAVWRDVGEMNEKAEAKSVSGAMKDGFEAKRHTIEEYRTAFKKMRRQKGVLVAIGGRVVALEMVSSERAYRQLHPKIIRSYALDALLYEEQGSGEVNNATPWDFLGGPMASCTCEAFPSVGLGKDVRVSGGEVTGSALVYQETPVHLSIFTGHRPEIRESYTHVEE